MAHNGRERQSGNLGCRSLPRGTALAVTLPRGLPHSSWWTELRKPKILRKAKTAAAAMRVPRTAGPSGAENGLSAIIVPDPQRGISLAYGVNIWPTIVFLDASGLVRKIRYGRFAGEHVEYPSREKAADAR